MLSSKSRVKLGNGVEVTTETELSKSVVMLQTIVQSNVVIPGFTPYQGYCTATFISDTTLITAGHCVTYSDGEIFVKTPGDDGKYVASVNKFVTPEYRALEEKIKKLMDEGHEIDAKNFAKYPNCDVPADDPSVKRINEINEENSKLYGEYPSVDIGLVVFPKGTGDLFTGGKYAKVATSAAVAGMPIKLISYGSESSETVKQDGTCSYTMKTSGFGTKRSGENQLVNVSTGTMLVGVKDTADAAKVGTKPGTEVSLHPGDSGGAWFFCADAACADARILAVSSIAVGVANVRIGRGTSVWSKGAQSLFQSAIKCDKPPCADNFPGSGVEPATPALAKDVFLRISPVDANGKQATFLSTPKSLSSVQLCQGDASSCKDQVLAKPDSVKVLETSDRRIFELKLASDLTEGSWSLVAYDEFGFAAALNPVTLKKK